LCAGADCAGGITPSQDVTGPEEQESCAAIEIDNCTDETLPTGTFDGSPFHKCLRDCP
jgi:hypothetical protein